MEIMNKCPCYHFETKRRYLSNIDKITYTLSTERLAPEYIDEEVGVCYGTKERDVCNCDGNRTKCSFYEKVKQEGCSDKVDANILTKIEELIQEYWGSDPMYYTSSNNEEEARSAQLCCKILELIKQK